MADRESRDRLALALRRLATGQITNDEFDDNTFESFAYRRDDPALAELAMFGWLHYDDFHKYRLRGRHALSAEARKGFARAVLFLKTNQEYVHSNSLTKCTTLGQTWFLDGFLIIIGIAVITGAITYLALNIFLFGFILVLSVAYVGYLLFGAVAARIRRHRQSRSNQSLDDTFWPFIDDLASMEQFRYWPFADKASYETALAHPPFLGG